MNPIKFMIMKNSAILLSEKNNFPFKFDLKGSSIKRRVLKPKHLCYSYKLINKLAK